MIFICGLSAATKQLSFDKLWALADDTTRLLCATCQKLVASGQADEMSAELAEWWENHQQEDRAREASEQAQVA